MGLCGLWVSASPSSPRSRFHSGLLQWQPVDSGSRLKATCSPVPSTTTPPPPTPCPQLPLQPVPQWSAPVPDRRLLIPGAYCDPNRLGLLRRPPEQPWRYVGAWSYSSALLGAAHGEATQDCGSTAGNYEGCERESSLKDVSIDKEAAETQSLEAACEKLNRSISGIEDEILYLKKELKEEKYEHSRQHQLMAHISEMRQSLEDLSKSLKSKIAEAKMPFKMFQMNGEQLKMLIKDALDENSQLQESQKHLLQEAEVWEEQVSGLNKQKITLEDFKVQAEQVLNDKENHIKTLNECLLKKKDWAAMLGEDRTDGENLELEMNSESENDAYLDHPPKGALKKLMHAVKLNASLKILEEEINQIGIQLSEIDKMKKELMGHIKHLHQKTHFERENQKLQQKLEVMPELHQETTMRLYKILTVEENYQAHDNWLAARTAEINLNALREKNAKYRHELTDTEIKFKCLHKDPSATDIPNTGFGREHYTYVTDVRRGTPFPLSPPGTLFGVSAHHIPASDFPDPPHAPFAVKNAFPPRGFPLNLPPRPGFFPPTPNY
ncbi:Melanoma inhibitory activity protein 2 [Plecturocebus cupreus]